MQQIATRAVTNPILEKHDTKPETQKEYNMRLYDCPLDHTPNAETIAAMQEVQDMIDGKIPCKTFSSFDEFWADLNNDD